MTQFRVIVFDNRGAGQSQYKVPYNSEDLADDVAALLDALKIKDQVTIVGHSMGGFVAQYFAVKYPQKLNKLMLYSTCIKQNSAGMNYLNDRIAKLKQNASDEEMLRSALPWLFSSKFITEQKVQQMLIVSRANLYPQTKESLLSQLHLCINHDSSEIVDKINVPTLIVTGEEDRIMTIESCNELKRKIQQSEIVVVPNAAHMLQIESTELMFKQITDFSNVLKA